MLTGSYTAIAWTFTGIAAVMSIAVTMFYTMRIFKVCATVKQQSDECVPDELPPVSVIVYSNGDSAGLAVLLEQLKGQDYPACHEIIAVNDGRDYDTEILLNSLAAEWPELKHTFTPEAMRNVSRKKLAITLGMKAAAYDAVIHVTSATRIESPCWLRRMAAMFNDPSAELVIGYACPDPSNDTSRGSRRRAHDSLVASVHYLASALTGHAYRGDGDNLGYCRELFFKMKGFSNSLNLHYGDDDIFVCDASTADNTRVMIARDAQVKSVSRHPVEVYESKKYRYDYTSRYCDCRQNNFYDMVSVMMWAWLLFTVAALATGYFDVIILGVLAVSALVLWVPQMTAWWKVSRALSTRRFLWSVPGALLLRPLRNFSYRLRSRRIHTAHFAWQAIGDQQ